MTPSDVDVLFRHLAWVRDRILARADHVSVPLVAPAPATLRDLRATLVHELDVEWSWRVRLSSDDRTSFAEDDDDLDPADFPSVAAIRARWLVEDIEMRTWLATLDEAALNGPCRAEHRGSHPLWYHLQHLYSHGIQQFSDAATLLTAAGRSPGEIDFLEFVEQVIDR
jgi:uncharacterized damage-inducible protein DinB